MARRENISRTDEWHQHETKLFIVAVSNEVGTPVDLAGVALEWQVRRWRGDPNPPLIVVPAADFAAPTPSPGSPVANVASWEVPAEESGLLAAGWLHHELWDRDHDALLVYGGALLQPGFAVVAP